MLLVEDAGELKGLVRVSEVVLVLVLLIIIFIVIFVVRDVTYRVARQLKVGRGWL